MKGSMKLLGVAAVVFGWCNQGYAFSRCTREGMGDMVLHSQEPGCIRYDILHEHGGQTLKFLAFFIKEADGNWKIWNF